MTKFRMRNRKLTAWLGGATVLSSGDCDWTGGVFEALAIAFGIVADFT